MVTMSNWFDISLISEDVSVYAIQETGHFEEAISYLVIGEKKAALIDTGLGVAKSAWINGTSAR